MDLLPLSASEMREFALEHLLTVIAQRSGFADAAALRAQFVRHIGLSPRAFRLAALTRQERLAEAMLLSDEQSGLSSPVGASET
ncbi:hypothetical protein ACFY5A_01065 [Microbacterium sp. NPDC012755]|uniref:hypothetical protein n=1 Tax=Microbacterium sp. NPDC012755 TaxID=3364184 RepID=UPI0036C04BE7